MAVTINDNDSNWSLYPYRPVTAVPILFAVIIFLLGSINIWQNFFRYGWKRFGFIMTWASLVWVAGFVCRAISEHHDQDVGLFIAQYVMVLVGPPLYAASETFILGRVLAYLPYFAIIHPGRVLSTFLLLTVAIEALSANGAARLSNYTLSESEQKSAYGILEAALILNGILELCFMSLAAYIWVKAEKANTLPSNVKIMLRVLFLTSSMMLVRCIVRTIEVFETAACGSAVLSPASSCAYITKHEWIIWVFEVANITLFVIALTIWTPGAYLPHSHKVYLDMYDGKTERVGPGFAAMDKRPLIVTILDPFNLFGIVTGRGAQVTPFWEERHEEFVGQEILKGQSTVARKTLEESQGHDSV